MRTTCRATATHMACVPAVLHARPDGVIVLRRHGDGSAVPQLARAVAPMPLTSTTRLAGDGMPPQAIVRKAMSWVTCAARPTNVPCNCGCEEVGPVDDDLRLAGGCVRAKARVEGTAVDIRRLMPVGRPGGPPASEPPSSARQERFGACQSSFALVPGARSDDPPSSGWQITLSPPSSLPGWVGLDSARARSVGAVQPYP